MSVAARTQSQLQLDVRAGQAYCLSPTHGAHGAQPDDLQRIVPSLAQSVDRLEKNSVPSTTLCDLERSDLI